MKKEILKNYNEIEKYSSVVNDFKHQCKICGRKMIIPNFVDRQMCDWCGHWIYRTAKIEFKYKMMEQLKCG